MILLTDILFPSKYAKWRIEEIKAFIDLGETDILVSKVQAFAGIIYDVDYEEMQEYFDLKKYNIVIFDPRYNYLNKYNTKIDGTKFNRKSVFSYAFTMSDTFDIKNYDTIYHIFLSSHQRFNSEFLFPQEKQFIHLYPGGGYSGPMELPKIPRKVNIICTQPFTSETTKRYGFNSRIDAYGSTLLPQDHVSKIKQKNSGTLRVCFASMGQGTHKGSDMYANVAATYKKLYPMNDVEFLFIGTKIGLTKLDAPITFLEPMSQAKLDEFYNSKVDILINAETGVVLNGWPLGAEAAIQGSVLITTDVNRANVHFKYDSSMLFITTPKNQTQIIDAINKLYNDRNLLHSMSKAIQEHSVKLFCYENQQQKIFNFIDSTRTVTGMNTYRNYCPKFNHENTIFKLKSKYGEPMTLSNVDILHSNVITYMTENLKEYKPFTMVRYNDGEWIAALKIQDNSLYTVHYEKWKESGQKFVDEKILPILKKGISYNVGVAAEVMKKPYMMKYIRPYMENMQVFDGGLFARMSIDGSLLELFKSLKDRNVIVVGPNYLSNLKSKFNFSHIETPILNVWNDFDKIFEYTKKLVEIMDQPVILYACSFVAKVLIDKLHESYSDTITQLDIGAALDVLSGVNSRPWHSSIKG